AVSLGANILFIVFGVSNIVYTGSLAIAARRVGERNLAAALEAGDHGVCLGAALWGAGGGVGCPRRPAVVRVFGAGTDVEAAAIPYLRIMFAGQVFLYVSIALGASYQAFGDTRTPMLVNVAVVLVNGLLDPFFIFSPGEMTIGGVSLGWLGWGVNGGAIAAVFSGIGGMVLLL